MEMINTNLITPNANEGPCGEGCVCECNFSCPIVSICPVKIEICPVKVTLCPIKY